MTPIKEVAELAKVGALSSEFATKQTLVGLACEGEQDVLASGRSNRNCRQ
jgi:hypothetical protein